jgi:hypothetical protein
VGEERHKSTCLGDMREHDDECGQKQHPKHHIGLPPSAPPAQRLS